MERRLTTIFAADLVGWSRLSATDEEGAVARLRAARAEVVDPAIAAEGGRIVKTTGDGLLAEFASPVAAVRAALAVQRSMAERETDAAEDRRLQFRIGVNLGDVVIDGDDLLGDGVNVAARLEALAPPGGACVSRAVRDQLRGKIDAPLTALGPLEAKNLPEPIEAWLLGTGRIPLSDPARAGVDAPPRVVVLPFREIGPPADDFFADGVVEEVTNQLSCVRDFAVIARQSAYSLNGRDPDLRTVGRELGARYAVTGSIRRSGERLRISVQLSDARSGDQIWSARYDELLDDLFDLQDRIASHVAGALSPSIRASEIASARAVPPADRGAYALLMSAYPHFWAHREEENARAIELLDMALARNPDEFRARALRAWSHAQQACYMWTTEPLEARARAAADAEAAALAAGDHAPSLVAIGAAVGMTTMAHEKARALLERAVSLDPNSAWGWLRMGWNHSYLADPAQALACFDKAEDLSPRDPFLFNIHFGRGFAHGLLGDYAAAATLFERGMMAGPGVTWAYRDLASFYANAGRRKEADATTRELLRHYPDLTVQRVMDSMPPAVLARHRHFFDGLRRAGVPES